MQSRVSKDTKSRSKTPLVIEINRQAATMDAGQLDVKNTLKNRAVTPQLTGSPRQRKTILLAANFPKSLVEEV